jgi:hypothetical protein
MVSVTILLCATKILRFQHCAWKFCQAKFLGRTGWKGERGMSTLNTAVVPLLIVYPHTNGVMRVGWELGATNDSFVVL